MIDFGELRARMVHQQLEARGISNPDVLAAMGTVPREAFVQREQTPIAYHDAALPLAAGQSISQPYIVALMIEAAGVARRSRVLEVGCGSGYAAAVLSCIALEVFAVERHAQLAESARERLHMLGYTNVHVVLADGSLGLPQHAPYDAIIVSAGGPHVPHELREQLALGGRLLMPVGDDDAAQELVRVSRTSSSQFSEERLGAVHFVPLIGAGAWSEESTSAAHRAKRA